ncbi:MAG: hypothetical protein SW019_12950 [Actinomycetota bacterium]|nr:hypothetical protein [Actinomycetota bacterium]
MRILFGKSLVGLVSAACITVPAGMPPQATAAAGTAPAVTRSPAPAAKVDAALFDPVPATLRLVAEATLALRDHAPGIGSSAAITLGDNPLMLAIDLLTFPYHNVYGVTTAVGEAFTDFLMAALLPLSVTSFVLVNEEEKIPAYVDSVLTDLAGAIPGIFTAIRNEIAYDVELFSTLLDLGRPAVVEPGTPVVLAGEAPNPGLLLLDLLTFPYHNVYAVTTAVGEAFTDFLMAALLPLSVTSFVLVNEEEKIPAYVDSVLTNLRDAIPDIVGTVRDEIAYDLSLVQQVAALFGAGTTADAAQRLDDAAVPPAEAGDDGFDTEQAPADTPADEETTDISDTEPAEPVTDFAEPGETDAEALDSADDTGADHVDAEPQSETVSDAELESDADLSADAGADDQPSDTAERSSGDDAGPASADSGDARSDDSGPARRNAEAGA